MRQNESGYFVDGFLFREEEEAEKARKELEGIKYLKSKATMDDPETVLQIYNRSVEQELFETPVGLQFLKEMQEYLVTIPYIKDEDIMPIPVKEQPVRQEKKKTGRKEKTKKRENDRQEDVENPEKRGTDRKYRTVNLNFKKRYQSLLFVNLVLVIIIIAMFTVSLISTNNVNILNYESKLINKYEAWEAELDEREAELDAREAEIDR